MPENVKKKCNNQIYHTFYGLTLLPGKSAGKFGGYFFTFFRLTIDFNINKYRSIWWLKLFGNDMDGP